MLEDRTARARIRDAVEELLDQPKGGVGQPQIVQFIVRLIDDDIAWRQGILADAIAPVVRSVTAELLSQRRRLALEPTILTGASKLTARQIDEFVDRHASKFDQWVERGSDGAIKSLFDMRKADLRQARAERGKRVLTDLHVMSLYATLEAGLEQTRPGDDEVTVGEIYNSEQVARLAATSALPATNDAALVALFPSPDEIVLTLPASS